MDLAIGSAWIQQSLLLSLRLAPMLAFAPPFTLVRAPLLFRVLLAFGLAASVAGASSLPSVGNLSSQAALISASGSELIIGGICVLAMQVLFGAIAFAGRTIDLQAGYGMALLIDPTTQGQTPLIGTFLAYLAGAIFFALDGHADLIRIMVASTQLLPLGAPPVFDELAPLTRYVSLMFFIAIGAVGAVMLVLLAVDITIAAMSRTLPQMNVLLLGFQVKTLATLVVLPLSLGAAGAVLTRLIVVALETAPRLL